MRFTIFQDSKLGDRDGNEDRVGYSYSRDVLLMVIADGMGGHLQGEVAAEIAVSEITRRFQQEARNKLKRPFDFLGIDPFAAVHPTEKRIDNLLGLVLAEVLNKTIEKMLTGKGAIDLGLFVVILQLGVIDDAISAGVLGLLVDLEHHLIGLKQHIGLFYGNGGGILTEITDRPKCTDTFGAWSLSRGRVRGFSGTVIGAFAMAAVLGLLR